MDLGQYRLLGLHAAHRPGTRTPWHSGLDIPPDCSRNLGFHLRTAHLAFCPFCKGTRDSRGHAGRPAKRRLHPRKSRARQATCLCPHHRRRRFCWTRGPNRSDRRIFRFLFCLAPASSQGTNDPFSSLRQRGRNRSNFPCSPSWRILCIGSDPYPIHCRGLWLRCRFLCPCVIGDAGRRWRSPPHRFR